MYVFSFIMHSNSHQIGPHFVSNSHLTETWNKKPKSISVHYFHATRLIHTGAPTHQHQTRMTRKRNVKIVYQNVFHTSSVYSFNGCDGDGCSLHARPRCEQPTHAFKYKHGSGVRRLSFAACPLQLEYIRKFRFEKAHIIENSSNYNEPTMLVECQQRQRLAPWTIWYNGAVKSCQPGTIFTDCSHWCTKRVEIPRDCTRCDTQESSSHCRIDTFEQTG